MKEGEAEVIVCRPTKWFYLRAAAMTTMFAVFLVLFLKDWKVGWPKKNEVYYTFQAFKGAKEAFREHVEAGRSAAAWKEFVESQKIGFPGEEGILPAGVDPDRKWPELLADYERYRVALEEEGNKPVPPLWTLYTDQRGWSSNAPAKSYPKDKIDEQLYLGLGSGVLMMIGVFFLLRTSRRAMKVDGEAYFAPNGERIPFEDIFRIDKRKWESKGLAYLYYGDRDSPRKAKVDGMVYGQFKPEEGAPAEALFQRITSRFSGEVVEFASEDEGEPGGEGAAAPREGGDERRQERPD